MQKGAKRVLLQEICIGWIICTKCGDLEFFHRSFLIDPNQYGMLNVKITLKHYESIVGNEPSYSSLAPRRINYVEDVIPISQFMGLFQNHIYENIKHSHRLRWKVYEFKYCREVFQLGTILLVVEFDENYTFSPTKEIQSEYYHLDQVSILVYVLHIHAQFNIDCRDNTD